jgi:uncharacterized protein YndB with AHSA1/START domain
MTGTRMEISADEPTVIMTRIFDAPLALVWAATVDPVQVREWWGGPGCTNPVCEMDVRVGGLWKQVMRFPDGHEIRLDFVFLEVDPPVRLAWENVDHGQRRGMPPSSRITLTLDEIGARTRWMMVARFLSLEDRDAALGYGFSGPIDASANGLAIYLARLLRLARDGFRSAAAFPAMSGNTT